MQMILDAVAMLLLLISTWQAYFSIPSCTNAHGQSWLMWQWWTVKLMWCIMCPILLGTWHRVAVLTSSREHFVKRCSNLEQDVSLRAEVTKTWHTRSSMNNVMKHCVYTLAMKTIADMTLNVSSGMLNLYSLTHFTSPL